MAVARVPCAVSERSPTQCNNKPLSLTWQTISIQMNLALCGTLTHLPSLCQAGVPLTEPQSTSERWGSLLWSPSPGSVQRRLLYGGVTDANSGHVCLGMPVPATLTTSLTSLMVPQVFSLSPSCCTPVVIIRVATVNFQPSCLLKKHEAVSKASRARHHTHSRELVVHFLLGLLYESILSQ